jgi:hypothetical protein
MKKPPPASSGTTDEKLRRNPRLLPRGARRAVVATCYLGYVAMIVCWATLPQPARWFLVIPLGLACVLAMGLLLMPYVLGISDGPDKLLDERQVRRRNETYLNAYRGLGALVVLGSAYATVASGNDWLWMPSTFEQTQAIAYGAWGLALTLPTAIGSWAEPDPPTGS